MPAGGRCATHRESPFFYYLQKLDSEVLQSWPKSAEDACSINQSKVHHTAVVCPNASWQDVCTPDFVAQLEKVEE